MKTKSIYSDRDYFDNMFKEIKDELISIREDLSGRDGRPGLKERVSSLERNIKTFVASLPLLSALYIKESREAMITLFKVLMP